MRYLTDWYTIQIDYTVVFLFWTRLFHRALRRSEQLSKSALAWSPSVTTFCWNTSQNTKRLHGAWTIDIAVTSVSYRRATGLCGFRNQYFCVPLYLIMKYTLLVIYSCPQMTMSDTGKWCHTLRKSKIDCWCFVSLVDAHWFCGCAWWTLSIWLLCFPHLSSFCTHVVCVSCFCTVDVPTFNAYILLYLT